MENGSVHSVKKSEETLTAIFFSAMWIQTKYWKNHTSTSTSRECFGVFCDAFSRWKRQINLVQQYWHWENHRNKTIYTSEHVESFLCRNPQVHLYRHLHNLRIEDSCWLMQTLHCETQLPVCIMCLFKHCAERREDRDSSDCVLKEEGHSWVVQVDTQEKQWVLATVGLHICRLAYVVAFHYFRNYNVINVQLF